MLVAVSCDKVPLLAPTGSVITLFPSATIVSSTGTVEIVATVIEQGVASSPTTPTPTTPTTGGTVTPPVTTTTSSAGAGTPVQNGTLVSFTTTLGHVEPREARTQNGEVRVKFFADGQSGTATITAHSGGASGRLENLRVGSAGVERVLISASPQALGCTGGTTEVTARVEDVSGAGVSGVPVTFTTTTGQLNPATAVSDSTGVARTQLSTSREAIVTANVAGKTSPVTVTLSPRTGITIGAPTTQVSAGVSTSFTVTVAGTANVSNVVLDFGDNTVRNLGPITGSVTIPHTFQDEGTFTVTATASDAGGCTERVSTAVSILPGQPPTVVVTASDTTPTVGQSITFTATVSGNTSAVISYLWEFGSGANPTQIRTTSNRQAATFSTLGDRLVRVTVTQASGPQGDGGVGITVVN